MVMGIWEKEGRDQRTCCSFSFPGFALSRAIDWQHCDLIGGEGGQVSQHGGDLATGHLGSQLPPSGLGPVGDSVVDHAARCPLPRHPHGVGLLVGDDNGSGSSRDWRGKRKVKKMNGGLEGKNVDVGFHRQDSYMVPLEIKAPRLSCL